MAVMVAQVDEDGMMIKEGVCGFVRRVAWLVRLEGTGWSEARGLEGTNDPTPKYFSFLLPYQCHELMKTILTKTQRPIHDP